MLNERYIDKAFLVKDENHVQHFKSESGKLYFMSGLQRNNDLDIGDAANIYYKVIVGGAVHIAKSIKICWNCNDNEKEVVNEGMCYDCYVAWPS